MSEPTPRQLRTEQLLDKAAEAHRKINENLEFLRKGTELGGVLDTQVLIVLVQSLAEQQSINSHLLRAVRNMAGSPAFDKKDD